MALLATALLSAACGTTSEAAPIVSLSPTTTAAPNTTTTEASTTTAGAATSLAPVTSTSAVATTAVAVTTAVTTTTEAPPEPTTTVAADPPAATTTTPAPAAAAPVVVVSGDIAVGGDGAPAVAQDPTTLGRQLALAESVVHDPGASRADLAFYAHLQQLVYRRLAAQPDWDGTVLAQVPTAYLGAVSGHLAARRAFFSMDNDASEVQLPAWRVVDPVPAATLLAWYQEAAARFVVDWSVLAAINLVETGMGRIQGLSVADARGPMQFLPSTWASYGLGGDIDDPHDSIMAAGYLLQQMGWASDQRLAVRRYNNSTPYVNGVLAYRDLLDADPAQLGAIHAWQIYYSTPQADIWIPTGYETAVPIDVDAYLAAHPQTNP